MGVNGWTTAFCCPVSFALMMLLGFGTFGSQWITGAGCLDLGNKTACCREHRNIFRCGHTFALVDINVTANFMVVVAFCICFVIFGAFFFAGWCWCSNFRLSELACCKPLRWHRCCGQCGGFLLLLFPLAAALSFAGCMIVLSDLKGAPFGWAFYVCLTASCLLLVISVSLFIYVCCRRDQYMNELRERKYGGAGKQPGRGADCMMCLMSVNAVLLSGEISDAEDSAIEL